MTGQSGWQRHATDGEDSEVTTNGQLKAIVDRIENVNAQIADLQTDVKEIYQEAKSTGFDPKIIRKIIAVRKKKEDAARAEAELMERYAAEIGMQGRFGF